MDPCEYTHMCCVHRVTCGCSCRPLTPRIEVDFDRCTCIDVMHKLHTMCEHVWYIATCPCMILMCCDGYVACGEEWHTHTCSITEMSSACVMCGDGEWLHRMMCMCCSTFSQQLECGCDAHVDDGRSIHHIDGRVIS